jgi:Transglutaminase-like superfamily
MRSAAVDFAKAARLPTAERTLLLQACVLLPAVAVGLRLLSLKTLLRLLDRPQPPSAAIAPERAAALVEAAAGRQPLPPTCLVKALALHALLRRRGIDADLVIGATPAKGRLDAHAWVEHRGSPLPDGVQSEIYPPLLRWSGRRRDLADHGPFE